MAHELNKSKNNPPASTSSFSINLAGGLLYLVSISICLHFYPDMNILLLCVIPSFIATILIVICEIYFLQVHKRPSTGLQTRGPLDKDRIFVKRIGFFTSIALMAFLYAIIPEYHKEVYYFAYLVFAILFLPICLCGWIYIEEIDRRMKAPYDKLWNFGNLILGRWDKIDKTLVTEHLKSLLLRSYYIPIMICLLFIQTENFADGIDSFISEYTSGISHVGSIFKFVLTVYFFLATIDVLFASIGYLIVFKALDSDIRSMDSTFFGWFICIICYPPFWDAVLIASFFSNFYDNLTWYEWFDSHELLIYIWGTLTVLAMCFEAITTLTFGIRFSNIAFRGLITGGPFRYTKHPQYISKMFNRFFYYVPFLSLFGIVGALQTLVMFMGLCFIYFLRARTEENHLAQYPEYIEYAKYIEKNGIFRFAGKIIPILKFSAERRKTNRLF